MRLAHRPASPRTGPISLAILMAMAATLAARADDWPQWRGPRRDGVWREDGIRAALPAGGIAPAWRVKVGGGYGGPAVANGRVYLMDYVTDGVASNDPSQRTERDGKERVLCLDAETGAVVWTFAYDCPYAISYACGPRCTPTVVDGKVFALGAEGHLHCLDAATGMLVWKRHFAADYAAKTPIWGYAGHPLVEGDLVICMVGGEGSAVVAFDRVTGTEAWRSLTASEPGYAPPSILGQAGSRRILTWDADTIAAVDPETGKPAWTVPLKPGYGMSIMAPQVADTSAGRVLFASGIGNIGALFRFPDRGEGPPEPVWRNRPKSSIASANSTPTILGDVLYGCDCETGYLTAVDLATGDRLWETGVPTLGSRRGRHGTAFIVREGDAGDRFWLFSETGDLILARLTPRAYEELGRIHLVDPTGECFGREVVWSHPAFAGRCVFARNDEEIVCVPLAR